MAEIFHGEDTAIASERRRGEAASDPLPPSAALLVAVVAFACAREEKLSRVASKPPTIDFVEEPRGIDRVREETISNAPNRFLSCSTASSGGAAAEPPAGAFDDGGGGTPKSARSKCMVTFIVGRDATALDANAEGGGSVEEGRAIRK